MSIKGNSLPIVFIFLLTPMLPTSPAILLSALDADAYMVLGDYITTFETVKFSVNC